jgi:hypothetical protein
VKVLRASPGLLAVSFSLAVPMAGTAMGFFLPLHGSGDPTNV